MPVVYGGMHSVVFIRLSDSTTKHSWSDLHLIPETRPTIALPEPKIQLIEIPGRSKRIDLTDYMPGGLTYGPRSGEFTFYVDHDRWDGWKNAYNELSEFFNGDKFAVYLMDNVDKLYEGRVYLTEYNPEDSYSTATLHYELEPDVVTDGYIHAIFIDSSTYGNTILQDSMLKKNSVPKYYGTLPQHPGYKFNYWSPNPSFITSDTTYTAVYREVATYTITFVDWDGTVLKSSVVNEDTKPVPPTNPTRTGYRFVDWDSEIVEANANKTYTATYVEDFNYYNSVWEEVSRRVNNGTYKTYYSIGDRVYLHIGDDVESDGYYHPEYNDYAQIVGIDADVDEDGFPIPLTFMTSDTLNYGHSMNETNSTYGGYPASDMCEYLNDLLDYLPRALQNILIPSVKYSKQWSPTEDTLQSMHKLWIPSTRELCCASTGEVDIGVRYTEAFLKNGIPYTEHIFIGSEYWTRTANNDTTYIAISSNVGSTVIRGASSSSGVRIGFCVGNPDVLGLYTITFNDYDDSLLKTYKADKGTMPVPPSDPIRSGYIFTGWSPELTVVTANQTYTATYRESATFNDSWNDVDSYIKNGSYRTRYSIGDRLNLNIGAEYNDLVQIVGIDADVDVNGNSIPLSFITCNCLNTPYVINSENAENNDGYLSSEIRTYIDNLETLLPTNLRNMIIAANKTCSVYPDHETISGPLRLWIPSNREVYRNHHNSNETYGVEYNDAFVDNDSLIKRSLNNGIMTACDWWTRSMDSSHTISDGYYYYDYITSLGRSNSDNQYTVHYIALGFCVGPSST